MSKNLTRKGLAFGALVALGASVIAGTPAQAATPLASAVTTSYSGTGLSIIEGTDFVVATTIAADYAYYNSVAGTFTATPTEQYSVCILWGEPGEEGDQSDYCVDSEVQTLTEAEADATQHTNNDWDDAGILNQITSRWSSTADLLNWDASSDAANVSNNNDSAATFSIDPITADTSVVYTPYIDLDEDGNKDANEPSGASTTIKFLNNTGTVLTAVLSGTRTSNTDQDLQTVVTGPTGTNMYQMEDDLEVVTSRSATVWFEQDLDNSDANVAETDTYNVGTGYYSSRVYGYNNSTAFSAQTSEVIVGQVALDSKITDIDFDVQASANMTENGEVRSGTKSFDISAQLYTADGSDDGSDYDAYAKPGQAVKFTAYLDGAQAEGSEIKINGTVITDSGVSVTVPSDAKGVAKAAITSKNGADGDDIYVVAETLTADGTLDTGSYYWSWNDAYIDNVWETHDIGRSGPVMGTVRNGQVTLNYEVTDQFAQPFSKAGFEYRVHLYDDEDSETEVNLTAPLVNGKASITFNNQDLAGVSYDVYAEIDERELNVLSPEWDDVWSAWDEESDEGWTYVEVNHSSTTGAVSVELDERDGLEIAHREFFNYNFELGDYENTPLDSNMDEGGHLNDDTVNDLEGYVVDANNVPLAGVPVTISSPGVQFADCDVYYSVNSITVYTDSNGFYEIEFFTNKAGANVFNVTSGGKSASLTLDFANPTALHATDVLTVSAASAVQAGTATPVAVKLVDKYGNGIDNAEITLGLVGTGYLSATALTTSKGAASAVLINGANDNGSSAVTATSKHATVGAASNLVSKTAVANLVSGSAATVKAAKTIKGRVYIVVENSINETVRVYANGKLVKKVVANSNRFVVQLNGFKKGAQKLSVSSNFDRLFSGSVTTK